MSMAVFISNMDILSKCGQLLHPCMTRYIYITPHCPPCITLQVFDESHVLDTTTSQRSLCLGIVSNLCRADWDTQALPWPVLMSGHCFFKLV